MKIEIYFVKNKKEIKIYINFFDSLYVKVLNYFFRRKGKN